MQKRTNFIFNLRYLLLFLSSIFVVVVLNEILDWSHPPTLFLFFAFNLVFFGNSVPFPVSTRPTQNQLLKKKQMKKLWNLSTRSLFFFFFFLFFFFFFFFSFFSVLMKGKKHKSEIPFYTHPFFKAHVKYYFLILHF
ncbi:uncharacterized protein SCDLUD_000214 [Saccharomycodes ludwigii]|uniref:uncharacterized protein n=1 Tax=Saccharomycodes ludwigii TaxID=36035 RepID=UPI001E8AE518|nr:hypothetical protein SCDLUD_000214 [Saccharomycodes ludwigii]KAH3902633.1 hypothetical protein SCDLUD_000214 [Saccharomycodes ludwigii]